MSRGRWCLAVEIGRQGAETCVWWVGQLGAYFSVGEIKEGRSDLASRSSNCKCYLQARSFERAPRACAARQPSPRLQACAKALCRLRAGTSLCSTPKVRRQDPAGESYPPRLSPGGVGAAAATAGEHGRLPRGARRRKKRHERWNSQATRHRSPRALGCGVFLHLGPGPPLRGAMCFAFASYLAKGPRAAGGAGAPGGARRAERPAGVAARWRGPAGLRC